MLKLELTNHNTLKAAFESISNIVDEIVLIIDSEALYLRALTRDHITFVTMQLDKEFFDEFQCDKPEKIFIDATEFHKILKKAKNNEILQFTLSDDALNITLKGNATRKFKLPFIDFNYDNPTPPSIEVPCHISIPSDELKTYINDMADIHDVLTFTVDQDYLKIMTEGQNGSVEIEYLHGENINTCVTSLFGLPKLQSILKASKFSKECTLGLGEDMPLILRLELITGYGYLEYLLAPRLSEE